jgi:hypothetical protein
MTGQGKVNSCESNLLQPTAFTKDQTYGHHISTIFYMYICAPFSCCRCNHHCDHLSSSFCLFYSNAHSVDHNHLFLLLLVSLSSLSLSLISASVSSYLNYNFPSSLSPSYYFILFPTSIFAPLYLLIFGNLHLLGIFILLSMFLTFLLLFRLFSYKIFVTSVVHEFAAVRLPGSIL